MLLAKLHLNQQFSLVGINIKIENFEELKLR